MELRNEASNEGELTWPSSQDPDGNGRSIPAVTGASCFDSSIHIRYSRSRSPGLQHEVEIRASLIAEPGQGLGASMITGLSDKALESLAGIMPLLLCGEQSAVMVFANLDKEIGPPAASQGLVDDTNAVMARISCEEHFHEYMLSHLVHALRSDELANAREMKRRTKLFFLRLLSPDPVVHLARLSALDSYVARTLSALQCSTSALRPQPTLMRLYNRIRWDEGGHVRVTRDCLTRHGIAQSVLDRERELVASAFTTLLDPYFPLFDAIGVEPSRLRRSIN